MNKLKISLLIISVFLLSYGASSAQELFVAASETCTSGTGSPDSSLYRVDPNTAQSVLIGPIGFNGVTGLAQLGDRRLVATANADESGVKISILIEINPRTGEGKLIGPIGIQALGGCGRVPDITYDHATDTLYGLAIQCGGVNLSPNLITINPATGAGTIIGPTGFQQMAGNALAINSGGTLIGSGFGTSGGLGNVVFTVDPMTGLADITSSFDLRIIFNSFDFQPETEVLFGTLAGFPDVLLSTVNPLTGELTTIGSLPDCSDAIVFFNNLARPIPTLSEWGLIAMAGVLGIIGLLAIRRRKVTAYLETNGNSTN